MRHDRGRRLRQVYSAHVGRSEETAQVSDHAAAERYQQRPPVRVRGEQKLRHPPDHSQRFRLLAGGNEERSSVLQPRILSKRRAPAPPQRPLGENKYG